MSNFIWNKTPYRQKLLDCLEDIPEIGKKNKSEILEMALTEFVERHLKSQNPQTTLDSGVKAIPQLYEILDHPEMFKKYYKLLDADDINHMAKAIQTLTAFHMKEKRRFE